MIIKPRIRGFICTAAHPTGGAALIDEQIRWVKSPLTSGAQMVVSTARG